MQDVNDDSAWVLDKHHSDAFKENVLVTVLSVTIWDVQGREKCILEIHNFWEYKGLIWG